MKKVGAPKTSDAVRRKSDERLNYRKATLPIFAFLLIQFCSSFLRQLRMARSSGLLPARYRATLMPLGFVGEMAGFSQTSPA
jgi:hypothetical protein